MRQAPLADRDECFLTAEECAQRLGCHRSDWWAIASANRGLKRGCKQGRGRAKTRWLASAVARYLRSLAGGTTKPNPKVEAMRAARARSA